MMIVFGAGMDGLVQSRLIYLQPGKGGFLSPPHSSDNYTFDMAIPELRPLI
jgi:hypothetical protein